MVTLAQTAERQSIQDLPDAKKGEGSALSFWYGTTSRGFILPAWGTRERERMLRLFYRHEYNWLGQSAITGMTKKVAATPWEIKGKKNVRHFQDVLRLAHFGAGWGHFVKLVLLDYFRQDGGAYIEVIAPGNPLRPPTGKVTGIAHLDSLRCYPTGDPEYPVIYYSRKGKMHLLHRARVIHLVDAPDGDESNPGYGMCALSRAISIVARQIHMTRYVESKLDDNPPPGFVIASGITEGQRRAALSTYQAEQGGDTKPVWGKTAWFYSLDPSQQIKLDYVTFAQAPDNWSFIDYNSLDVNAWAAALGEDVQEIWQLTGGNLGSGEQSEILHAKSQGKTYGDLLTTLERGLNDILPESLEHAFKRRDPYDEQERATTAQLWAGFVSSIGTAATDDEKRRILANQVEPFKDAVTDENGEITRLNDADVEPENNEQTVDDATPQSTDAPTPAPEVTTDDAKSVKAIAATRLDFENAFEDLLAQARAKDISRRTFSIRLRSMLAQYGEQAYKDGLQDGGVDTMDIDDNARYAVLLVQQSKYVSAFGETLYADGVSDTMAAGKPALWYTGSVKPFYDAGLLSADRNGNYLWSLGIVENHCTDCPRLSGQIHRLKGWASRNLLPGTPRQATECGGWRCGCKITRTTERARGTF